MSNYLSKSREGADLAMRSKLKKFLWIGIPIVLLGAAFYALAGRNPLPKDEELIAHFYAHRADIEELVRRYREYEPLKEGQHHLWKDQGDTPVLLEKVKIRYLDYEGVIWLPDPYSVTTGEKIKNLSPGERIHSKYRYAAIRIRLGDDRYFRGAIVYTIAGLRVSTVFKHLVFFPEVPRIENGWIMGPVILDSESKPLYRMFESLDDFPPDWGRGQCAFRKIEPKWFIKLCNA